MLSPRHRQLMKDQRTWKFCYPMTPLNFTKTLNSSRNGRTKVLPVKKRIINIILFLAMLIFSANPGSGQENPLKWGELTPGEKQVLTPLQEKWDKLSPAKQHRLNEGAKAWNTLNLEQKKSFKQKLQVWKQKIPDEKLHIRKQFARFQNLPETEKQALRKAYEEFKHQNQTINKD
ncbi:MAG: hypothetical protein COW89_03985 [Nitrospinae bacterium CG22_combo_CG10-13_8_21_14_all_47_10]|nr:MAG: hypothetical protein COW89_03985 [Nitrospinae bacterium CG22_combo_CG10-13_8_21_14_all_47_10]